MAGAILKKSGERFKRRKLKKSYRQRSCVSFCKVGSALGDSGKRIRHVEI